MIGDPALYAPYVTVREIADATDALDGFAAALPVLARPLKAKAVPGRPDPANAEGVLASIEEAVGACRAGVASGVVTNPIAKAPLYDAGFPFPGHTEYLADLTADVTAPEPRGPVMMLVGGGLRVALATIHLSLRQALEALTPEVLARTIRVTDRALRQDFAIARPRLALCGLNPHAGEGGSLGLEEREIFNPLAQALRAEGIDVSDARSADALFSVAARDNYDAAIAMYHDQGLIPVKTLDFYGGVNVTLGLPVVRTSPDHGVAFDIAGKGRARPDSLIAAIELADQIAATRFKQ